MFALITFRMSGFSMGGPDRVCGMSILALFYAGIAGSAILFGRIAGHNLSAGCDISSIFCQVERDAG